MPDPPAPQARHDRPRRPVRFATWLLMAIALGGCASLRGPAPEGAARPPPVPATWSGGPAAAPGTVGTALPGDGARPADAAWWARFGDGQLDALIAQALVQGTDVQVASARWRQARALREQAAAGLSPRLDAGASGQAARSEGRPSTRSVSAALDAAWEPDLSGGRALALDAATADEQAGRAALASARVTLAAEVALAYLDLRGAQARLAIAEANLASQEESLQISRWRVEAGLVSTLDADQAESAAAQTRSQLPALRTAIAGNAHALAVLTGQPPAALLPTLSTPRPLPAVPAEMALELPAEVLRRRPDVAAAEARVRAAAARVAQADAARLPSLSLGGSIGLNALSLAGLTQGGAGVATLAAGITWPVFDGGRLRAQVQAQEAAWDEALGTHRATVLAALQEVEHALVAIDGLRRQQDELDVAVAAARRAADLAQTRYEGGLTDFTTVLTTRRTLLALEDSAASAAAGLASQHVRLYKAAGGGWPPAPDDTE